MARRTFKVLFYVNGSKEKNGIVPIMGWGTIHKIFYSAEDRGLSQKSSTFVIGLRQLFPRHIVNKRRYVFLHVRSLRTFKQWKQEMI